MSRFSSERGRKEFEEFQRQDAIEQERLAIPGKIKELEREITENTRRLNRAKRDAMVGYQERPYITPGIEGLLAMMDSEEQVNEFNAREAQAFVDECTPMGWFGSPANCEMLISYFARHGIGYGQALPLIDKKMWRATFLSFQKDGLLEQKPEPEAEPVQESEPDLDSLPRLPLSYQRPSGWKRESDGSQIGIDPLTGKEREYTGLEIERMTADEYKRAFRLSIPALTKANFAQ